MRPLFLVCVWACACAGLVFAQPPAPTFAANSVLPAGEVHATPLAPGLIMSIYGDHLGPATGCQGPRERLCDAEVLVDGVAAVLLYVQERQINFQVPQQVPEDGVASVQVVYRGQPSRPAKLPASTDFVAVYQDAPAKVGSPVWLNVLVPGWKGAVRYPFQLYPAAFGCTEVEVRRDGQLLPRIADLSTQAFNGIVVMGNPCGFIGLPAEPRRTGRLPLHLQYHFDQPGTYEVRYTMRKEPFGKSDVPFRSQWTAIEILPGSGAERVRWLHAIAAQAPSEATELLSDLLPSILGIPDAQSLALLLPYLYDPDLLVRQYAVNGLTYWPDAEANRAVQEVVHSHGPSDVTTQFLLRRPGGNPDALVEDAIPYLLSASPVLLRGAVDAMYHVALFPGLRINAALRIRAENALFQAEEHVIGAADAQTINEYACALGLARDDQASAILWDLVRRNVAREQALIALTWRHAPADLPKIAQLTLEPANGQSLDHRLASLPYALHRSYGDQAIPYLETMLARSEFTWVRTESARELVLAGRPSGFAFMVDAIETSKSYRWELIQFVRGQFPELAKEDDTALLSFLKARANSQ